jgi:hypothetical protein
MQSESATGSARIGTASSAPKASGKVEAYLGGHLRHKGSKVAKTSKTMVIGMAERNGPVHLESMTNRRFESVKPVLDARTAERCPQFAFARARSDGNLA